MECIKCHKISLNALKLSNIPKDRRIKGNILKFNINYNNYKILVFEIFNFKIYLF